MRDETSAVPQTLKDAIVYFSDPAVCLAFACSVRWPDGVTCVHCGSMAGHTFISTRKVWRCRSCRKQFSVRLGTIMEDSPLPLSTWMVAIWLLANCKNGVSSYEIARDLGITQKSAWHVLHRVRAAMKARSLDKKLSGIVETDECHVGGLIGNMHKAKAERVKAGRKANSATGKTIVQAVLERNGEVRAQILADLSLAPRLQFLRDNVEPGSQVMTDEGYESKRMSESEFVHEFVNHQREYVRGNVHRNGVENFWSLMERTLGGTYVSVEPYNLSAYVDEQCFRFNNRKTDDAERFVRALSQISGRRLTWADLTRKATAQNVAN
jgi:transposase-like protein